MGGVVKAVVGGGDSRPAPAPEPEKPKVTAAETQAAMQRQAALRARGRSARGLMSEETLGKQTTLG